ncbi:MAG: hypothetical protein ACRDPD_10035, partial [Streptosporangiaceae bacterium]
MTRHTPEGLASYRKTATTELEAELADRYEAPASGIEDVVRQLAETVAPVGRRRLLEPAPEAEGVPLGQREALAR